MKTIKIFTLILFLPLIHSCELNTESIPVDLEENLETNLTEQKSTDPLVDFKSSSIISTQVFSDLKKLYTSPITKSGQFYRIDIGNLLGTKDIFALFTYFENDRFARVQIDKRVADHWTNVFSEKMPIWENLNDFRDTRFEDFTGDGIKEIIVPESISPSHSNHSFYCLVYSNSTFKSINEFSGITNPQFDPIEKTIHSLHGGGIGNYIAYEYKLEKNKLVETKKIRSGLLTLFNEGQKHIQIIKEYELIGDIYKLVKIDSVPGLSHVTPKFWTEYYEYEEE